MRENNSTLQNLKKEIGERFRSFRLDKKKAQNVLATELQVHQSTITNIEHGLTFPKVNYLHYFYEKYGLNLNWMVTGEGNMYLESLQTKGASIIGAPRPGYEDSEDSKDSQYEELSTLMQIPAIEQVMFAKLSECKIFFKDHVKEFFKKREKENREQKIKASRAKVKKK